MSKFVISILFSLFFLNLNASIAEELLKENEPSIGDDNTIRIGIVDGADSINIEGDAFVYKNELKAGTIQGVYALKPIGTDGIMVGKESYLSKQLLFEPKISFLSVGNKIFRGKIEIFNRDGKLVIVNDLDLEDYVKGVINREIIPSWPLETKKVQAVLARTYAFYQKMFKPRSKYYDLAPSVLDQVYGGLGREDLTANQAVSETRGEIITYQNMPAEIYFHSTCGGRTASSAEVWKKEVPYLQSIKCPYCKKSSTYRWSRTLTLKKLFSKMKKNGYTGGSFSTFKTVNGKTRVDYILAGKNKIPVNRFRHFAGYSFIWSNNFKVKVSGGKITFSGKGSGHGVGVCQWGAAEMAKEGKKYIEIIYYYLGNKITIKKMY